MEVPQKIKNKTTIIFSISTSECKPEENEALIQKDICNPMFTAAMLTTTKIWKKPRYPQINEMIKMMWYTQTVNIIQP